MASAAAEHAAASRPRILVVEDDSGIADLIQLYLGNAGLASTIVESAEAAERELNAATYHVVVLDINLPGRDGFAFLRQFRANNSTPVIIVTARDSDEDEMRGLGIGADDFVTKPFSPKVLVARVQANLRYLLRTPAPSTRVVRFGPYAIDLHVGVVELDGRALRLAPKETELLLYLVRNAGRAFSPDELYRAVWGNRFGDLSTVTVHVQRLRKKLSSGSAEQALIETVHRVGYRANPALIAATTDPPRGGRK